VNSRETPTRCSKQTSGKKSTTTLSWTTHSLKMSTSRTSCGQMPTTYLINWIKASKVVTKWKHIITFTKSNNCCKMKRLEIMFSKSWFYCQRHSLESRMNLLKLWKWKCISAWYRTYLFTYPEARLFKILWDRKYRRNSWQLYKICTVICTRGSWTKSKMGGSLSNYLIVTFCCLFSSLADLASNSSCQTKFQRLNCSNIGWVTTPIS